MIVSVSLFKRFSYAVTADRANADERLFAVRFACRVNVSARLSVGFRAANGTSTRVCAVVVGSKRIAVIVNAGRAVFKLERFFALCSACARIIVNGVMRAIGGCFEIFLFYDLFVVCMRFGNVFAAR